MSKCLAEFGLSDEVRSEDLIVYHDAYLEPVYDKNTPKQLGMYMDLCMRFYDVGLEEVWPSTDLLQ